MTSDVNPKMDVDKSPPFHSSPSVDSTHRRRRRCLCISLICFSLLVLIAITFIILAFTIFQPREPTITVITTTVQGVSPQITFPALSVHLNLTLVIDALVTNPNRVSFSHGLGTVSVFYRGVQVGDADVPEGTMPDRGSEEIRSELTLDVDTFVEGNLLGDLVGDVIRGELGLDTQAKIPGRVTILGFIKKHLIAVSDCHVVIGFPGLDIRQQVCNSMAKL